MISKIKICHNQKIRKLEWRSNFTMKDFIYLIKSTFDINENTQISGFNDNLGFIF